MCSWDAITSPAWSTIEGYLAELRTRGPDLDEGVERYLSEALRAYQSNLYYSAMAMLGCSSERAIVLLMEAFLTSIDNEANQSKLRQKLSGRDISMAYEKFKASFDSTRKQVNDPDIVHDFDMHVDAVFTFIRLLRNSIMHPTAMPNITNALIYSNLQQFSYYIETVFKLTSYYQNNKTTL